MARTKPSCFCFCSYFALFRSVGRSEQLCRRPRVSLASALLAVLSVCLCLFAPPPDNGRSRDGKFGPC